MDNPFQILLEKTPSPAGADVQVRMVSASGRYVLGPPTRPNILHDKGALEKFKPEPPTEKDRENYARWRVKGEIAYAMCRPVLKSVAPPCEDADQRDATAAYLHYLGNTGSPRTVPYDNFLLDDEGGKAVDREVTNDIKVHIEAIGKNRSKFQITSAAMRVGEFKSTDMSSPNLNKHGPKTINWRRTIGKHTIWVSADVTITAKLGKLNYHAEVTIHMEDTYNFNPGDKDATTGIPDDENGRFQVVGLAKQYLNVGTATRTLTWAK